MPSFRSSVPCSVPTTAGSPSSRLTMAAWQVRPPRLVTIAAAFFIVGSQSGSVLSVTRTSPFRNSSRCCATLDHAHGPVADLLADAPPADEHVAPSRAGDKFRAYRRRFCDCTVSGRACTMNNSPVCPSLAHSMSIGVGRPRFLV